MEHSTSVEIRSPHKTWKVDEVDVTDASSHVRFTTPDGFEILVEGLGGCIELLTSLVLRGGEIRPGDGTRLYVNPEGIITLIDSDPWVNPNFKYMQEVTNATTMAYVIKMYVLEKLGG